MFIHAGRFLDRGQQGQVTLRREASLYHSHPPPDMSEDGSELMFTGPV